MDRYRKEVIDEIAEPLIDLAKTIAALESRVADARDKYEYRRHDIIRGRLLDTYSRWHDAVSRIRDRDGWQVASEVVDYVQSQQPFTM